MPDVSWLHRYGIIIRCTTPHAADAGRFIADLGSDLSTYEGRRGVWSGILLR